MSSVTFNAYLPQISLPQRAKPHRWPFSSTPRSGSAKKAKAAQVPARSAASRAAEPRQAAVPRSESSVFAGATGRQIAADVLMVASWGALIPGLLWFGHWMGF